MKKPQNQQRGRGPKRKTTTGDLLRAARENKNLTLQDVEEATGLSNGGIAHVENGRNLPSLKTAIILCALYGLPLDTLAKAVTEDEL